VLARFGGPDANGLIPSTAARFGFDIARADGTVLLLHELSETVRIPFERRVAAQGSVDVTMPIPANPPVGTSGARTSSCSTTTGTCETPYFRAALADPNQDSPPDVELARTRLP